MEVMPSDQTSTLPSYWPSSMARITSGAILEQHTARRQLMGNTSKVPLGGGAHQYGVPTKELAGATMEAEPKSPSLT